MGKNDRKVLNKHVCYAFIAATTNESINIFIIRLSFVNKNTEWGKRYVVTDILCIKWITFSRFSWECQELLKVDDRPSSRPCSQPLVHTHSCIPRLYWCRLEVKYSFTGTQTDIEIYRVFIKYRVCFLEMMSFFRTLPCLLVTDLPSSGQA